MLEFNMFKWNSTRKAGFQSFPHVDFQRGDRGVAALVYLNTAEETSGGTQFYKVKRGARELDDGDEAKDTMVNVTGYDVLLALPMRYNRLVLYVTTPSPRALLLPTRLINNSLPAAVVLGSTNVIAAPNQYNTSPSALSPVLTS